MKKIALITGSSRGIGAATALCLAKRGYEVCINFSRDGKAAGEVAAAVDHAGGKAIAVQADVSSERAVEGLFREIDERLGRLTALVNNAGILLPQSRVESMTAI